MKTNKKSCNSFYNGTWDRNRMIKSIKKDNQNIREKLVLKPVFLLFIRILITLLNSLIQRSNKTKRN